MTRKTETITAQRFRVTLTIECDPNETWTLAQLHEYFLGFEPPGRWFGVESCDVTPLVPATHKIPIIEG